MRASTEGNAMKTITTLLAAAAFLIVPIKGPAQTSTVPWSVSGMGYEVSSSPTTKVMSLVGQRFVGTLQGAGSIIESGFLADTLFRTLTSVTAHEGVPKEFMLEQNFPNPFNPSTTIQYALPVRSHVSLTVFNTLGQEISVLRNGEQEAGYHDVKFDGTNLPSGVYFYRMQADNYVETRKLLLLR
jgi:hypothetical protein